MGAPEPPTGEPGPTGEREDRIPSVIVSDLDVTYRVFGTGRRAAPARSNVITRALSRTRQHVGVREVQAVRGVSFIAYRGESIGIIGRNGSGKSTLLRTVAGLVPPTRGDIYLNGTAALLGVNAVLMRNVSGARNIMIGGQALGLSKSEVRKKYREIVQFADIGEFLHMPMSSYSSGMAARLRFAISTAAVPDILVVDEALATGDAEFRAKARTRIEEIKKSAGTIFMVSHSAGAITSQCERALWMDQGHLVMDGPAKQVVAAYEAKYGAPTRRKRSAKERPAKKPEAKEPAKKTPAAEPAPQKTAESRGDG